MVGDATLGCCSVGHDIFDFSDILLKLESGLLKQLGQFSDTSIKIIISEVVKNELLNHLEEKPKSLYTDIGRFLKDAQIHCQFEGDIDYIKRLLFQGRKPEEIAYNRLENFIETTSIEIIQAQGNVEVFELLNKYFKNESPFAGTGKKKNEFPDAMALMSLESWAEKNGKKVLVISEDSDWKQYCTDSQNLVLIKSLSECFELFQQAKPYNICRQLSEKYYQGELTLMKDAITSALEDKFYELNFYIEASSPYQYEDEITNVRHKQNELKIIKEPNIIFRPIHFDNDTLVVEAKSSIDISVECTFYFTTWDSIDKEEVAIGTNTIEKEQNLDVTVLLTLIDESEKFDEEIEVNEIEITTTEIRIYFDCVEPDWRDESDDD
ncbi:PIN domain-containing protein [Nostoc sp.]|uniref:PIN domain-containing protein n=1 Tax=Nostoc sp. TaxID=1180 RepID=UPI002FFD1681